MSRLSPNQPPLVQSVLVLGGGIIARTSALRLQQMGCQVTLVAEPDAFPPSWGNAGHIATEQVQVLARFSIAARVLSDYFPKGSVALDWRAVSTWLPWCFRFLRACKPNTVSLGDAALQSIMLNALPAWQRLAEALGRPDLLDLRGTVKLWEGRQAEQKAFQALRANHHPSTTTRVDEAQIAIFNTVLASPVKTGVHFAGTAHITSHRAVLDTLLEHFLAAGGKYCVAQAVKIEHQTDTVQVTTNQDQTLTAERVIIACGVRSAALLPHVSVPLVAERGYHIEWNHGGRWELPNVVFEDRALVVTRFGARLRATSFVEFTRDDAPPDPRKWQRLEAHVAELGLPVASAFERWHGSRPTLPDYLPAIGAFQNMPRVVAAYGHNHLGLTLAPVTAELLSAHLVHGTPIPAAFRPDRFR